MNSKKIRVFIVLLTFFAQFSAMAGVNLTYLQLSALQQYLGAKEKSSEANMKDHTEALEMVADQGVLSAPRALLKDHSIVKTLWKASLGNLVAAIGTPIALVAGVRSGMTNLETQVLKREVDALLKGHAIGDTIIMDDKLVLKAQKFFNDRGKGSVSKAIERIHQPHLINDTIAQHYGQELKALPEDIINQAIMVELLKNLDLKEKKIDQLVYVNGSKSKSTTGSQGSTPAGDGRKGQDSQSAAAR